LRNRHINPIPAGTVRPATSVADEIARLAEFSAVFRDSNGTPIRGSNRLDPRFNVVTLMESSGKSSYHAMQADIAKTFSHGYQLQVAYTWSKSIDDASDALSVLVNDVPIAQDPFHLNSDRAVSQFDIPHRLVIDHLWEPEFFQDAHGFARKLLHGWGFNGI